MPNALIGKRFRWDMLQKLLIVFQVRLVGTNNRLCQPLYTYPAIS